MTRETADEAMARYIAAAEREGAIMLSLSPDLPDITRLIMAGDIRSGEDRVAQFRAGEITAEQAVHLTGSFARLTVATTLWGEGALSDEWVLSRWPSLWRGSDPDDTDPHYWDVWRRAAKRNGGIVLDDPERPIPGKGRTVPLYRGQRIGDPVGCSWTTDAETAHQFATGAGQRAPLANGRVLRVTVPKAMALAYLTGRGEDEVILDPREMGWVKTP